MDRSSRILSNLMSIFLSWWRRRLSDEKCYIKMSDAADQACEQSNANNHCSSHSMRRLVTGVVTTFPSCWLCKEKGERWRMGTRWICFFLLSNPLKMIGACVSIMSSWPISSYFIDSCVSVFFIVYDWEEVHTARMPMTSYPHTIEPETRTRVLMKYHGQCPI